MERDRWQHGREWDLAKTASACTACGSGCSVLVSKKDGKIVKVNAKEDNGYICAIGRFGFDSLRSANRVTTPMKRDGKKLVATTWSEALKAAADGLKKAGANAGFIASGSLTNEEAMAVQALARKTAGSANIDTPASAYAGGLISALRTVHGEAGLGIASRADLGAADCVVVIGADPSQKKQIMQEADVMIRRRAQAGAKIIVVSTEKTDLAHHANAILLQLKAGTDTVLLAGLMSASLAEGAAPSAKGLEGLKKGLVTVDAAASASGVSAEQIAAAAKAYAAAKHPVVVIGTGVSASEEASTQALNLALLKDAGVLPLLPEANALGVMQMGCLSDLGPGFAKVKKAGKGYSEMRSGMKALLVAGNVPDMDIKADFLVVQTTHLDALAEKADVVLPMAALYERTGTIINIYGKQKTLVQAQDPQGVVKDGADIAAELSLAMSKTKGFTQKDAIADAKKAKAPKAAAAAFKPVAAKAGKPSTASATEILMGLNAGLLAQSAVKKVLVVQVPVGK
jgi:predicted molibdopterin-dependent oxidoreductase YjgC